MKEQWTDDLRNKLEGYESPHLPDELWDDIDKEMSASRRIVPIHIGWRKACAAIFLLVAISCTLLFLREEHNESTIVRTESHQKNVPTDNARPTFPEENLETLHSLVASLKRDMPKIEEQLQHSQNESPDEKVESTNEKCGDDIPDSVTIEPEEEPEIKIRYAPDEALPLHTAEAFPSKHRNNEDRGLLFALSTSYMGGIDLSLLDNQNINNDISSSAPVEPDYGGDTDHPTIPRPNPQPEKVEEEEHHRPISFGLQVGIPLSDRWTLHTGLSYSYLHSEFMKGTEVKYDHTHQRLHYLGVPLRLGYQIYHSRIVDFYLGGGGRIDFGLSGKNKVRTIEKDKADRMMTQSLSDIPTNLFLTLSPGVQVNIVKGLHLYLEPTLQFKVSGSEKYSTYFTEHPQVIDLQLGFRWKLGR